MVIKGRLDPFFETGTEGVIWSVYDDTKEGYDGLYCLDQGDYLTIFDPEDTNKVVWEGNIDLEYERNYHPYPMNPQYGQQAIGGLWVHGIQRDVEPDTWGTWFCKHYPCEMISAAMGRFYQLKSSTLAAYSYNGRKSYTDDALDVSGDLIIRFKGGSIYRYKDVEPSVFWKFYQAESKGKFHAKNIKNKYEFEKIELPKPAPKQPIVTDGWPFPVGPKP